MKKTVWIPMTLLCVLLIVGFVIAEPFLFASSRCDSGGYTLPPDAQITVYQFEGGHKKHTHSLRPNDPSLPDSDYSEITGYLEGAYCDPVRRSLVSFAPVLVVETDQIRVNIQSETVIISIREDAAAVWKQGTRKRRTEDDRLVERLLGLLEPVEP